MPRLRRQIAIASAGRAASTSLYMTLVETLRHAGEVRAIWEHASGEQMARAYAEDGADFLVIKAETFHFVERLEHRDRTTLILLRRRDHLRQVVSHLVSLRTGRFHGRAQDGVRAPRFAIAREEFLALAYMVLMMERFQAQAKLDGFDDIRRWDYEDLVADFAGHLRQIGIDDYVDRQLLGVRYDASTVTNMDEVAEWARALESEGFRFAPMPDASPASQGEAHAP